ncbi:putative ER to Golgi transport-related protein [Cutaneotrichosporon oleaginosum]|uniref:Putative ER to Golgi transport-related protein n=1 Tax=Cutaneotrichosporon oleaginosum TaxID=879819 RepID=A0A0J0XNQ0_9TREE|nr:putative ER to Golgi transport-related protein [Cutaneotrichosporon oleaginosum]KLT42761.1 putative ER to Golgi transport-related protein [Cutaneotrichosporon oleaginosum]TXT09521.1 hypothetical protein COLE_03455 [Cutaneotrichosporon oleaginosum]
MRLASFLLAAVPLLSAVQALHFYFESNEKRCFLEELPSDTIVEGHYRALLWDETTKQWTTNPQLGITVNVEDLFSGNTVVNTRGPHAGRFTFASSDAADHNICLHSNLTGGWMSGTEHIKMYLDITVGSSKLDASGDKQHADTLATKLQELNQKVADIQREQRYMREVEATFRDASEATNTKAVWYVIMQICILLAAGVWQMRHLKVYFEDKKLR